MRRAFRAQSGVRVKGYARTDKGHVQGFGDRLAVLGPFSAARMDGMVDVDSVQAARARGGRTRQRVQQYVRIDTAAEAHIQRAGRELPQGVLEPIPVSGVGHHGGLGRAGVGRLMVEAPGVERQGRILPADLGLYSDETEAALHKVLGAVRRYSSMPMGIQLAHAGRKASSRVPWEGGSLLLPEEGGWPVVAPSPIAHGRNEPPPVALDEAGLQRVRDAFAQAAQRAARLGFDLVEVHAAHGYLLHQFLSPLSNQRTDQYGGALANRMRFPLEVFAAVREAFPADKPVGVRISGTDWADGGWDIAQSVAFSKEIGRGHV